MKKVVIVSCALLLLASCNLVSTKETQVLENDSATLETKTTQTDVYDAELAKKYGADDYGMKKYVMAYLKKGPNRNQDSVTRSQLQRAHLDNIIKMANEGKLVLAGPFLDDGDIRGIYIFNVETVEEAEAMTNTDPAIRAGSLVMELHPWYGSAALMEINTLHKKISKQEP
ncbi:MAG: hypothetical protein HC831_02845 [Chloroflexia bacterium]|nr:hypothetical protein [Chloroflexia bacterium]